MKKIVSRFLFPMPLSFELLFAGLLLLWFTRRQRAGKALVTCGALLLGVLSNRLTADALLHPLEHRYPALVLVQGEAATQVSYIAVLGGWANDDPGVPASSHLSPDLMVRLVEGARLHREIPGSRLILSGYSHSAVAMANVAGLLGVSKAELVPLGEPRDTEEESRQIGQIVGPQQFILVTSASHMPRAMGLFQKRGLHPIPAPTDYLAPRHGWESDDFVPDGYKLFEVQSAFYEYLGLAWERLRGKI